MFWKRAGIVYRRIIMTRLPHPIPYQGSKRKLAPAIARYLPNCIDTFYEPFAGSAAMTVYAAHHRRAKDFVIADSLVPMVELLRSIVEEPGRTAIRYRDVWEGQRRERTATSTKSEIVTMRNATRLTFCI